MTVEKQREEAQHTLSIIGCARCCSDGHRDLIFTKLTHAHQPWDDREPYTHWSSCPTNGEPILLAFMNEREPVPVTIEETNE